MRRTIRSASTSIIRAEAAASLLIQGVLQTDGYSGYEKISCEEHALCWVHARRYFVEAIPRGLDTLPCPTTSANGLDPFKYLTFLLGLYLHLMI